MSVEQNYLYPFMVAPMMGWTDRHCRYFLRCITKKSLLYTEMVSTGSILFGDAERFLKHSEFEKPLALQLGGSCPSELARSVQIANDFNYDEINLNVGCPSPRVQQRRFGACLMAEPQLVADCVKAMSETTRLPITVKSRIGIDHQDSYEQLCHFIETVQQSGCRAFIIHARKAWLHGLSPRKNREIPPLRYEIVHQIRRDFPQLHIIINGGFHTLADMKHQLSYVDGVMVGRAVYHNPYLLAEVDQTFYSVTLPPPTRQTIINELLEYTQRELENGTRLQSITRHILGLFHGLPGARKFRRHLSENVHQSHDIQILNKALELSNL